MICANGGRDKTKCASGTYNLVRGSSTCDLTCTVGHFCPPGYPGELLCPPGHYCEAASEYPTQLPETSYSRNWGLTSASDSIVSCPEGYTCPAGTVIPVKCAGGVACPAGSGSTSVLTECPAGTFSGSEALTSVSDCIPCWKGHFCPAGV